MLSNLRNDDVYAFDEDILKLKKELNLILTNLDTVVKTTLIDKEAIQTRIFNALKVVEVAKANSDKIGVVIW